MTSARKSALFAWLLCLCTPAHAQRAADDAAASRVTMTVAYVESCLWMDELHRSTCARIGANLSEKNRKLCATSDRSFAQRISVSYPAFKQRHHPTIAANEASIASAVAKTRASLERQFAQMRAGKVSMPDLDSLARELGDRCTVVEAEWLR